MESREHFEQFTHLLAERRRRAEAMARSLRRRAAEHGGGRDAESVAAASGSATTRAERRRQPRGDAPPTERDERPVGAVLLAEVAALADAAIEELGDAEAELVQQNEALFEAQLALDASNRHYRDLFELAPAAYVVTTLDGVIREINRAGSQLLGRPRNFAVGKPLALFVAQGEERAGFRGALERLRGAERVEVWRMRLAPTNRPPADVTVSVRAVPGERGAPALLYWLLCDEDDSTDDIL